MYDSSSRGISYSAGFFMLIAFAIAGVIFAALIYAPVWTAITGKDVKALSDGVIAASDTNGIRAVQAIYGIVGFFLPAVFAASLLHRQPFRLLGFSGEVKPSHAGMVILLMLLAVFVSAFLTAVNHQIPIPDAWQVFFKKLEMEYQQRVEAIVRLNSATDFVIALVIMALLPAICEETLFRGGLQNFLARATKNPWLAIIIVGIIFSIVHLSFYGFLSRLFLGVVLGLIYHYSGKLWLCILAHFFNNALALTAFYISKSNGRSLDETIEEVKYGWWGLLFLPLLIMLFRYFRNKTAPLKDNPGEP